MLGTIAVSPIAKCPKCEGLVTHCELERISVGDAEAGVHALAAVCPLCRTVLGVSVDPGVAAEDMAYHVVRSLRKRARRAERSGSLPGR